MRRSWRHSTAILYGNQTFLTYEALLKYKSTIYNNQHILEIIKKAKKKTV